MKGCVFMGQCTSCSHQRPPNFSSAAGSSAAPVPQTPEYELNPDSLFKVPGCACSTKTTATAKIHPALKLKSRLKKSTTTTPTHAHTTSVTTTTQEKEKEDGSMNIIETTDNQGNYHRKSSKKYRVSPQPESTVRKSGLLFWTKSSNSEPQQPQLKPDTDVKPKPPAVFLRKFLFLQPKSDSSSKSKTKVKGSDTIHAESDAKNSQSNNNEARPDADNNNRSSEEGTKTFSVRGSQHFLIECPISAVTLNALNSNREEKKQLRDLFLFGTTNTSTSISNTVTNSSFTSSTATAPAVAAAGYFSLPLFIASSEMEAKRKHAAGIDTPPSTGRSPSSLHRPPEKVKRTFQYQPPTKQSTIGTKIAALNLNQMYAAQGSGAIPRASTGNVNLNRHGATAGVPYGSGVTGRTSNSGYPNLAQPPISATRTHTTTNVTNANTLSPIHELNNNNNRPASSGIPVRRTFTTLKKPVEPRPFHTILYPARTVPTLGFKEHQENRGVVLQRKMFNQGKHLDEKSRHDGHGHKAQTNYPLQHDGSSSSGEFTKMGHHAHHHHHRGGGDHHHHAMSDSEYLDDEISDQPDLTLTFKDLSPSSSGESLNSSSCDMMLEKGIKREDSFHRDRDADLASDSAFSDTSSAKAIPPSSSASAITRLNNIDRLASPKHRVRSVHTIAAKTPSPSQPKPPKQNFVLRNLQQVSSPKDRDRTDKDVKTTNIKRDIPIPVSANENLRPKEPVKHVSPSKVKTPTRAPTTERTSMANGVVDTAKRLPTECILPSLPPTHDRVEDPNDSMIKSMVEDIEFLKTQLLVLKEELEEREKFDHEKDKTIEKLMLEIDILKRNNNDRKDSGVRQRLNSLHLDCEPATANAAAQTDSDTISPMRGISYDDCDKFGELVSFRIGRRISPSSSSLSGKSPDVSLE